ncbi:uncharacterized protein G2W53_013777 [Senna tora]|uniref:Uncharacterized protein n=1 Tax=Senna tora TaxID=362788 RepID=A0A834U0A0_9FABA|nr:uncharacterized protein G2W53_013777 [Senna tora]
MIEENEKSYLPEERGECDKLRLSEENAIASVLCAAFKLREENDVLFLAEDNVPIECLYSSSSEDEGDW